LLEKAPISDAFAAQAGGITPFALATPHQAPTNIVRAMHTRGGPFPRRPFAPGAVSPLVIDTGPEDYPVTAGAYDAYTFGFGDVFTDVETISGASDVFGSAGSGVADITGPITEFPSSWGPDDIFTTTYE
jgi:hypothetical protein